MTNPIYSETFLQSLPLPRLKEIAKKLGTKPVVDARFKKTWVLVILRKQARTIELVEAVVELTAIDPQPIERIEPTDKPMELPAEELSAIPIEKSQQTTPILIPLLSIALVVLMSICIVPALVLVSIALVLGQPTRGVTPHPQPIGSMS